MRWRRGRSDLFHVLHTYIHKTRKEIGDAEIGLGFFLQNAMYASLYSTLIGRSVPKAQVGVERKGKERRREDCFFVLFF